MYKPKAILFDFDGTLVETMDGFADIAGQIINEFHPDYSFKEARKKYLETSGIPFHQQLEIIFPSDKTNKEKALLFEERKQEGFYKSKFSDEVKNTINILRSKGILACVSSNNFHEFIDKFIENGGLEFDLVLGFRYGFEKGKDHFDYIMNKFSLNNKELIFVGDSLKDAEKAIGNGIKFIGLCGTFSKEDFKHLNDNIITIASIKELKELCVQ